MQYAWKLAHPTDKYMNREAENAEAYERVGVGHRVCNDT